MEFPDFELQRDKQIIVHNLFALERNFLYICTPIYKGLFNPFVFNNRVTVRDRAGVARWAHNPKVVGSNPSPATNKTLQLC